MNLLLKPKLKLAFFTTIGIFLVALFTLTFIQGILWQLEAQFLNAFADYFVAILCIAIDFWIFLRAKQALRVVEYSELHS